MLEIVSRNLVNEIDVTVFSKDDSRIALIDADSMLYYSLKADTSFDDIKLGFDKFVISILSQTKCSTYAGFFTDSKAVFRKDISKTRPYKGNRTGRETPVLFYALKAYAQRFWGFYEVAPLEADDLVALYSSAESTICSPDKDVLKQIPGKHYNYQKNDFVITSESEAREFLWLQAIAGDSVDGIPGVPGAGMKTAEKALLDTFSDDFPLQVLKLYLEIPGITEKVAIDRFKETFDLVYVLRNSADLERLGITLPPIQKHHILEKLELWG